MKRFILLVTTSIFCSGVWAQSITSAEYYFDNDPGLGNGNTLTVNTNTGNLEQTFNIPTTGLSNGIHRFCMRVQNDVSAWSLYSTKMLYVTKVSPANFNITAAEYYFDTDPGFGNGTALTVPTQSNTTAIINIPQTLSVGIHKLFIRCKTQDNIWSHYEESLFYVGPENTTTLVAFEYYIDTDEVIVPVVFTSPEAQVISNISTIGLSQGVHYFYIRAKTVDGTWSMYDVEEFNVDGYLSISEEFYKSITIYPNPTNDLTFISSNYNFKIKQILIYNLQGKEVFNTSEDSHNLDLNRLSSGTYILNLQTDMGSANYKLIKE